MAVKPGYKQTEVGGIPDTWNAQPLGEVLIKGRLGGNYANQDMEAELPLMKMGNLARGCFDLSKVQFIGPGVTPEPLHQLVCGDVLFNTRNTLDLVGKVAIWRDELPVAYYNSNLMRLEFDPEKICSNEYANYALNTEGTISRLRGLATGTTSVAAIYTRDLLKLQIPVPPLSEQRAIAKALRDMDALLGALERLVVKKRDLKQAAMEQLLTGQTRLPGFHGEWETKRIVDIASPKSEKNLTGENLPVLTCSKHFGFVDSLGFFKNQVFSKDLSTYKIIRRGEIGYPSNHVEEGSVGLQDLYDVAVVSPIYVVFAVNADMHSFFLHRLLKLDSYRQKFKTATTSSVDRRGSLRWPAFSEIIVRIPLLSEQTAIAAVLSDMEAELAALEQRLAKTRALKQGMMQELLTGRTRLV